MTMVADERIEHTEPVTVNKERLWSTLMELGAIGAYPDEATGCMGVRRLALTDAEKLGREQLVRWFEDAGLAVRVDVMGNIFGARAGSQPDLAPVMIGSHIDSVATAGAFDGCLGVLGGLEFVRTLNDRKISTRRTVVVAAWSEEEGVRFGTDMLGSAVGVGRIALDDAYALVDSAGLTFGDELERIGFKGDAPVPVAPPHAYLECHIEQGPILAEADKEIGIVTGVQAISWFKVTVHGKAAHAGTTPTNLRVDAGLAASRIIVKLRDLVDSGDFGELRSTVGQIDAHPGLVNVIPERVELTVDLRNPDDQQMASAEQAFLAFVDELRASEPGLRIDITRTAGTPFVPFDARMQEEYEAIAGAFGYPSMRIVSGAGHDAQEMASITRSAMVFVRGEYEGISHNPREYSTPEACERGINVLSTAALRYAQQS